MALESVDSIYASSMRWCVYFFYYPPLPIAVLIGSKQIRKNNRAAEERRKLIIHSKEKIDPSIFQLDIVTSFLWGSIKRQCIYTYIDDELDDELSKPIYYDGIGNDFITTKLSNQLGEINRDFYLKWPALDNHRWHASKNIASKCFFCRWSTKNKGSLCFN